ncbi:tyrosine-type recombinase/integrase [Paraburkholderia sp. CI3]|uniref:tyrosine-type recombinase/integrase n=1 Tax=Paraburkholderia sp. CI3 TaxID=2991060 RepID=UPI003D1B324E
MATELLTPLFVSKTKKPGNYPDGGGLYLQVSPSGTKSWTFRYKLGGKSREMGMGKVSTFSLDEVRERARKCRKLVFDGIDPIQARDAERSANRLAASHSKTFRECAAAVIEKKTHELTNAKAIAQWESTLQTYAYPAIGDRSVGSITKHDIVSILEPIWRTKHVTASRLRGRIEAVMTYAKAHDYCSGDNPADWKTLEPILGKPKREAEHHEALRYEEVGAFMVELRNQDGFVARALEFAILTAARADEVRGAMRNEIDFEAKVWKVPAGRMKGRVEHTVPLSDDAIALLKALPQIAGNDHLFPGARATVISTGAMWALLRSMGHADLTVHGFRSTFRDWAGETTAYPREVIEHAMAHKLKDKAEAAYARGTLLEKRRLLMADWATYCSKVRTPGDVVPIGSARVA